MYIILELLLTVLLFLFSVIVAVLDAFHFDLSKSTYTISKVPKAIEKETVTDDSKLCC